MENNYQFFMQRCLELALKGLGNTAPNPIVGSILVYNDTIIGEGFHEFFGGPHAEVNCINNTKDKDLIEKSTLFVSLEPCSHIGKTPPCADLIIKSGIKKVVVAMKDPNPLVSGQGIQRLRENGVEVVCGILESEAFFLNRRFITFHEKKRPYIILKWAQTKNGIIGNYQGQLKISNSITDVLVHKWRSEEAAILIGKNTAIIDNPRLNVRLVAGKNPIRILIDPALKVPDSLNVFNDKSSELLIFNQIKDAVSENISYIKFEKSNLQELLFSECYKRGILSILVEGGRNTLDYFLNSGNFDEVRVIVSNSFCIENENNIFAPDLPSLYFEEVTSGNDLILTGLKYFSK